LKITDFSSKIAGMIERSAYLARIKNLKDKPQIKMITGIRHGGKSFLFYRYIAELKQSGIDDERIIYINFESAVFGIPRTAREIESFIDKKSGGDGRYYIFFDEIQTVAGWEKFLHTLIQRQKFDIYVSASAAILKNGGADRREKKYIFINFKPVSFAEYKQYLAPSIKTGRGLLSRAIAIKKSKYDVFGMYTRYGGFPAVCTGLYGYCGVLAGECAETAATRLKDIYSSILLNDVIRRANIRNIELLEHIINIIFLNIGTENSPKRITESLRKKRYTKDLSLVHRYIKALESAFILKKVQCCNLLTGKIMPVNTKYFVGEHALLEAVPAGVRGVPQAGIRENILMHDLERREYAVYSGRLSGRTVDFVAKLGGNFIFLQTIDTTAGESVFEQKTETLRTLNNIERFSAQKKYVIFLGEDGFSRHENDDDGIQYFSLYDFLLLESV
jgi:predicted AAA+ superfamily ATPase